MFWENKNMKILLLVLYYIQINEPDKNVTVWKFTTKKINMGTTFIS